MATANDGYGYLEDRRPSANMDPYEVCNVLMDTVCKSTKKDGQYTFLNNISWLISDLSRLILSFLKLFEMPFLPLKCV